MAVLGASISRDSVLARHLRRFATRWRAYRARLLPSRGPDTKGACLAAASRRVRRAARGDGHAGFLARHAEDAALRPAGLHLLRRLVVVTQVVLGHALFSWKYYDSLIVLSSFLVILALGRVP